MLTQTNACCCFFYEADRLCSIIQIQFPSWLRLNWAKMNREFERAVCLLINCRIHQTKTTTRVECRQASWTKRETGRTNVWTRLTLTENLFAEVPLSYLWVAETKQQESDWIHYPLAIISGFGRRRAAFVSTAWRGTTGRWAAVRSRVLQSVWLFISVYFV